MLDLEDVTEILITSGKRGVWRGVMLDLADGRVRMRSVDGGYGTAVDLVFGPVGRVSP
jgi:hypothetical protein